MKNNKKKKQKVELWVMTPAGQMEKVMGIKMAEGQLLIPNPYYVKKTRIIERRPDT
jgi:hypothetical protein|tara:strand:- start:614 stop:781 length:168 start_codon:yes stop_codon:yes gene_type:complete